MYGGNEPTAKERCLVGKGEGRSKAASGMNYMLHICDISLEKHSLKIKMGNKLNVPGMGKVIVAQ